MFFAPLKDQRRSDRHWITLPVQIRMGKSVIEGTTLNLSEHGMYLFTAANLPSGAEIEVVYCPPEEKESVRVFAIIRRKVVYLYGIEFLNKRSQQLNDRRLPQSPEETNPNPLNSSLLRRRSDEREPRSEVSGARSRLVRTRLENRPRRKPANNPRTQV